MTINKYLLLICLFVLSFFALAQSDYSEMVTDRPDQTESAQVVPMKSLQIETGFVRERYKIGEASYVDYAFNSTLLRYGLLKKLELRLGLEYLGSRIEDIQSNESDLKNGLGALLTGIKYKILEEDGLKPGLALLGNLAFPFTSKEEFKSDHTAAGLRLALSQSLSDRFALGYNLGGEWDGDSDVTAWFYSISLGIGLSDKLGMFIESYGLIPNRDEAVHLVNAGFTYAILPNLQADISAGLGLNDTAIDNFIGFGLSYRIPGPRKSD